jgi:predicted aminopeptidase
MKPKVIRAGQGLLLFLATLTLSGCYYMQAARGQLEILRKREPIEDVTADTATPSQLVSQLQLITAARQFSIDELHLPDNDSYRSYADLDRDYVVWSIVAAPEFSMTAKSWCYPVVGCVSYRGYFAEAAAQKQADKLRANGYDVAFGGVAAYSTLGRFDDPVLNTMLHWGDTDIVATMFHELAHQVLYIKDDTEFNESFATAVEEIGMQRWLTMRGESELLNAWQQRRSLRAEFASLVATTRSDLRSIYKSDRSSESMRDLKQARLAEFATAATQLYTRAGENPPGWLQTELNNARLVSTTLYNGRVAEFRTLLDRCEGDLPCFYSAATRLAEST